MLSVSVDFAEKFIFTVSVFGYFNTKKALMAWEKIFFAAFLRQLLLINTELELSMKLSSVMH